MNFNEDNQIDKLIEHINKLEEMVEKLTDANVANNALVQQIANQIELKLDLHFNGEVSQQRQPKKIKNKKSFFKDSLKENINAYLDELYTQEDLDRISAIVKTSTRTEIHRVPKIADTIFEEIKQDAARLTKLNEIYEQYKANEKATE